MAHESSATSVELERQLRLLEDLSDRTRAQDRLRMAAAVEIQRLRAVVADAATRLAAMLAGQRATRAELRAMIDLLRAALEPVPSVDA